MLLISPDRWRVDRIQDLVDKIEQVEILSVHVHFGILILNATTQFELGVNTGKKVAGKAHLRKVCFNGELRCNLRLERESFVRIVITHSPHVFGYSLPLSSRIISA